MSITSLKVRGPFRGSSGYDHVVREFVRGLHRLGVAIELEDIPDWGPVRLTAGMQDPWFDSLAQPLRADTVLHVCMPHQVTPAEPGQLNANYSMFEATRIPRWWAQRSRAIDLVIVPTESSRRAWINGGVSENVIRVCPLGVDAALFAAPATPLALRDGNGQPLDRYRVRFLNVSEIGPRKNLPGLIRAWLRATSPRDEAVLILKLSSLSTGWLAVFEHQLERAQQQVGKALSEAAPVHFIREFFADQEMSRLYAAASHYISLSFGEGWDQPMVEAAASGLRLIAPKHSAYSAYLDSSIARLIDSRAVPAMFRGDSALQELFRGAFWWEPDEAQSVDAIRSAIDGRDEPPSSARERILARFTWERAAQRLIEILSEAVVGRVPPGSSR